MGCNASNTEDVLSSGYSYHYSEDQEGEVPKNFESWFDNFKDTQGTPEYLFKEEVSGCIFDITFCTNDLWSLIQKNYF